MASEGIVLTGILCLGSLSLHLLLKLLNVDSLFACQIRFLAVLTEGKEKMNEKRTAFAQRIEQNSKNYFPKDLFDLKPVEIMLTHPPTAAASSIVISFSSSPAATEFLM